MNTLMLLSGNSSNVGTGVASAFYALMALLPVGLGIGAFLLIFAIVGIIWLAVIAFCIVLNWKIFTKAGEPGWKCIIPYYNLYVMYDFATNTVTKNVCFFTIIGVSVLSFLTGWIAIIPYIGWVICFLFSTVFNIILVFCISLLNFGVAYSFGLDTGLCVLNIFIPIIPYCMLAFGKHEYQGRKLALFGKNSTDTTTV